MMILFLIEVVKNDSNSDVRREAINRISDESILKELEGKVLFDEYVEELVRLYKSQPEGFYIDSRSVEPVRYVGEKLSELGGFDIMLQAHKIFSNQINNGGLSGNLEMVGDGIGSWRG